MRLNDQVLAALTIIIFIAASVAAGTDVRMGAAFLGAAFFLVLFWIALILVGIRDALYKK